MIQLMCDQPHSFIIHHHNLGDLWVHKNKSSPVLSMAAAEGSWSKEMVRLLCSPVPDHGLVVLSLFTRL